MINKDCSKYCCEDISKIENYSAAISDTEQTWHCHHRNEFRDGVFVSKRTLEKEGLYYNRPAAELIFLPPIEHCALHNNGTVTQLLSKYPPITTFQDFLNEKNRIVKKYEFWNIRNPENKHNNDIKMRAEINELLKVYELCERGYFEKVAEAKEYGGRTVRKLLTKGE